MRLATYNIQYGKGKDGQFDLPRIVGELGAPDLIALQEVETFAARSGMVHQAEEIGALLPGYHWVFGPGIDVDASERVDGRVLNRRRQFGNMVLSRWPILSSVNHTLPKMALTGTFHLQRTLVETVVEADGHPLRFCSVHFDHVAPETRLPQVAAAMDILSARAPARGASWGGVTKDDTWRDRPAPPMPRDVILMGDYNFTYESEEYRIMAGGLSSQGLRLTEVDGLVDAWVAAGHDIAAGNTIMGRPGISKRIDHCFLSERLAPAVTGAQIGEAAVGSDHNPVFVDLDLNRLA